MLDCAEKHRSNERVNNGANDCCTDLFAERELSSHQEHTAEDEHNAAFEESAALFSISLFHFVESLDIWGLDICER